MLTVLLACSACRIDNSAPGPSQTPGADAAVAASGDAAPASALDARPPGAADAVAPDSPTGDVPVCGSLALCDGFETGTGTAPDPALWSVLSPNCSGDGVVAIDDTVARSGTRSARVTAGGGYCDHVFVAHEDALAAASGPIYGRFFVRFADELGDGHVTFMTMADGTDGRDLRMGGQNRILMWNRELNDATLPELSPAGVAQSVAPSAGAWTCVEFMVDGSAGALRTWVGGSEVGGLVIDDVSTPDVDRQWLNGPEWAPMPRDLKLGWESYAGQSMTLWFDDVAVADSRIYCD